MALIGTMKAPSAAMLLLALVAAAAVVTASDAADQPAGGAAGNTVSRRHGRHGHHGSRDEQSPLTGLTQCVTICGSEVTTCLLNCYGPLSRGDPVALPICLLSCTNDAMVCASGCSTDI